MPEWFGGSALSPNSHIPLDNQWRLQWQRIIRWDRRVQAVREEIRHREPTEYDIDIVIVFLQNCYHLRDWLQACRPDLGGKVDTLFDKHLEMKACRDVCNGFKHKHLNRPSLDPAFNLYREFDHFEAEANPSSNSVFLRIAFADGQDVRKFDRFDFSEKCFGIWRDFLAKELPQVNFADGSRELPTN